MWRQRLVPSRPVSRIALTCAALWLLAMSPTSGQEAVVALTGVQLDTGLMRFLHTPRRAATITVTELGARNVSSTVRIAVYGPDDQLVARGDDTLMRGQPVTFTYQISPTSPPLLRFSIAIFGVAGRNTQPVVVLEDVDGDKLTIGDRIMCAPPVNREGPVTPYCPPVVIRNITIGG